MFTKTDLKHLLISLGLFILLLFLIWVMQSWVPIGLSVFLISGVLVSLIFAKKKLDHFIFYSILILLPFNLDLEISPGLKVAPLEILCALNILSFLFRITFFQTTDKFKINKYHLGFGVIVLFLLTTTLTSTIALVSIKYTIVWLAYMFIGLIITPYYISQREFKLKHVLYILGISVGILSVYALINFFQYNFERSMAPLIARPFFKDHTVLSATISLLIPVYFYLIKTEKENKKLRTLFLFFFCISLLVVFLASSRAAWLGLIFSGLLTSFILLKGRWIHVAGIFVLGLVLLYNYAPQIEQSIASNRYNSDARDSGLKEQALSLTNISSDVSNMERINRWKCAMRMFRDKPLVGFGPGTFQFQYLPYQLQSEMTRISVKNSDRFDDGHGGTAHSEIFLTLSESGVLGLISWILLWILIFTKGIHSFLNGLENHKKFLSLALLAGISTYLIHSLFNNFLNIAQFGILFWILIGLLFSAKKRIGKNGI